MLFVIAARSEWRVYPGNRDARARLTEIQFTHCGRVHRLDPTNTNIPAKLLGFLVAYTGTQAGGRISLHFAGNVTDPTSFVPRSITITRTCCTSSLST